MTQQNVLKVPELVIKLYRIVSELEELFPGRKFTPDGHLVGSIGEVIAAHDYNLQLLAASNPIHDAKSTDGRSIQIKATQGNSVGLSSEPDILLVLKLMPDGTAKEVYNGPGCLAWKVAGKMQKNGQRAIGVGRLRKLMAIVPKDQSIELRNR